jgi:hypothetical protein
MSITAASFIVLEDGTRAKKAGTLVYEGQPVRIMPDGTLAPAIGTDKVYGLSKLDSNNYRDFAFGEFGAFGSGQLTVVLSGVMSIGQSVFNQIEVDSSTTTASAPVTVKLYDDTKTYIPGQALYVDAAGLISNTPMAGGKVSLLGKVLKTNLQTGDGSLEIEIGAPAATSAAELA